MQQTTMFLNNSSYKLVSLPGRTGPEAGLSNPGGSV